MLYFVLYSACSSVDVFRLFFFVFYFVYFFFLSIPRPPRSTQSRSSAASDVYKRQAVAQARLARWYIRIGRECDIGVKNSVSAGR